VEAIAPRGLWNGNWPMVVSLDHDGAEWWGGRWILHTWVPVGWLISEISPGGIQLSCGAFLFAPYGILHAGTDTNFRP
jgi:hypothetical protein